MAGQRALVSVEGSALPLEGLVVWLGRIGEKGLQHDVDGDGRDV